MKVHGASPWYLRLTSGAKPLRVNVRFVELTGRRLSVVSESKSIDDDPTVEGVEVKGDLRVSQLGIIVEMKRERRDDLLLNHSL